MTKKLYIQDFGAVGDGVTDDTAAIVNAVIALQEAGNDAVLIFESNKTYYFGKAPTGINAVFQIYCGKNLTIKGDNTTILTDSPNAYMLVSHTTDLTVEGLRFNYRKKTYLLVENADEINLDDMTAVFTLKEPLEFELKIGEKTKNSTNFGTIPDSFIDMPIGRWHMYPEYYELIDNEHIKVYFKDKGIPWENQKERLEMLRDHRLILPVPKVAQWVNVMFNIWNNTNFTMRNVDILASSQFVFSICNNDGNVIFDTVNVLPEGDLDFVSWRDLWHCKENKAKFIWRNCKASGIMDDIFNLSASSMYLKEIINERTFNFFWPETKGAFRRELKIGDPIELINTETGVLLGKSEISAVIKQKDSDNIIVIKDVIENVVEGPQCCITFPANVEPGSIIENCEFDGTWRFRGPVTVKNCKLNCRRMWLDMFYLFGSLCESPVPRDIYFKDCEFTFENDNDVFVHANLSNDNVSENSFFKSKGSILEKDCEFMEHANVSEIAYHIKNVVFEDCVVNPANFDIGTGDEVIFKNCTLPEK